MKTIAAVALSAGPPGGLSLPEAMSAGLFVGGVMLLLGLTGTMDLASRAVPGSIVSGIQLAVGLQLAQKVGGIKQGGGREGVGGVEGGGVVSWHQWGCSSHKRWVGWRRGGYSAGNARGGVGGWWVVSWQWGLDRSLVEPLSSNERGEGGGGESACSGAAAGTAGALEGGLDSETSSSSFFSFSFCCCCRCCCCCCCKLVPSPLAMHAAYMLRMLSCPRHWCARASAPQSRHLLLSARHTDGTPWNPMEPLLVFMLLLTGCDPGVQG